MFSTKQLCYGILALSSFLISTSSAQTIAVFSGDGQLQKQSFPTQKPLIAIVKDTLGQPLANAVVTWSVAPAPGCPQPCNTTGSFTATQSFTDITGQASTFFVGGQILQPNAYSQTIVTGTAFGVNANFTVTTVGSSLTGAAFVQALVDYPQLGDIVTGPAGSLGSTPIRVRVVGAGDTSQANQGIPGVAIRLDPEDPTVGLPSISCSGNKGVALTDITGTANCTPLFGKAIGSARFKINVGEYQDFGGKQFTTTVGVPTNFRITNGNNQTGTPGLQLPLPLLAQIEDAAGNPLPNIPVVWEVLSPVNGATLNNQVTTSDSNGRVSCLAVLGGTAGAVTVRVRTLSGNISATFTLQITLVITGLTKVAGDNQSGVINTDFASPLIVQIATQQGQLQGVQVQFIAGGGVTLVGANPATTDGQGRASIGVRAGASPGTAVVTAAAGNLSAIFNLSIRLPGPGITNSSFFNGAGGQAGGVSPSAIVAIYGAGIGPGLQGCVSANQILGPLPLIVSQVTVQFSNSFAPIYAVCNLGQGQEYVVVQTPADLPLGNTTVTMRVGGGSTTLNNVPVTPVSIGIFETLMSDGRKRAVILRPDGSYVSLQNPARRGDVLRSFVTGIGTPVTATGQNVGSNSLGVPGDPATSPYRILLGVNGEGVTPNYVKASESLVGVMEIGFTVQDSAATGQNISFGVAAVINEQFVFGNASAIPIQ